MHTGLVSESTNRIPRCLLCLTGQFERIPGGSNAVLFEEPRLLLDTLYVLVILLTWSRRWSVVKSTGPSLLWLVTSE